MQQAPTSMEFLFFVKTPPFHVCLLLCCGCTAKVHRVKVRMPKTFLPIHLCFSQFNLKSHDHLLIISSNVDGTLKKSVITLIQNEYFIHLNEPNIYLLGN